MNIKEILEKSPRIKGWGKTAFYSIGCCWWTSFPKDLGKLAPVKYNHETKMIEPNPGGPGLPCCPHCGSLLMQAPLDDFIKSAKETPFHYGEGGLDVFVQSHERNSHCCFTKWAMYKAKESE